MHRVVRVILNIGIALGAYGTLVGQDQAPPPPTPPLPSALPVAPVPPASKPVEQGDPVPSPAIVPVPFEPPDVRLPGLPMIAPIPSRLCEDLCAQLPDALSKAETARQKTMIDALEAMSA